MKRLFALFLGVATAGAVPAPSRPETREIDLDGLKVWLGQPIPVTAQVGWHMDWVHSAAEPAWSFVHLTPFLARFPQGGLIATYTLDPDTADNPVWVSGFNLSSDHGRHWGRRYSLLMQHNPLVFIPKPPDSLLAIASEFMLQSPGDRRNFVGPSYLLEAGGRRLVIGLEGVHILDWPYPVVVDSGPQPPDSWHAEICLTGSALEAGGGLVATLVDEREGDPFFDSVAIVSHDGGYTWRYFSTIEAPDRALAGQKGYEGPNETSLVRLAGGDLMAVIRQGGGRHWSLHREYSHDGGQSWSRPDVLPAWSVKPQLIRLANGVIGLSTGRPGVALWLSGDDRARHWQMVDLLAYHNAVIGDPSQRIGSFERNGATRFETTSYTATVEVSPNHLLLVYDRDPERAPAGPNDLSRVYVLPIEVERN